MMPYPPSRPPKQAKPPPAKAAEDRLVKIARSAGNHLTNHGLSTGRALHAAVDLVTSMVRNGQAPATADDVFAYMKKDKAGQAILHGYQAQQREETVALQQAKQPAQTAQIVEQARPGRSDGSPRAVQASIDATRRVTRVGNPLPPGRFERTDQLDKHFGDVRAREGGPAPRPDNTHRPLRHGHRDRGKKGF